MHTQFYVHSGLENHLSCGVCPLSWSSQRFSFGSSSRAVSVCLAGLWGAAVSGSGTLLTLLSLGFTQNKYSRKGRAVQGWGTALGGHSQPGTSTGVCTAKGEQWTLPACSTWQDHGELGGRNEGGYMKEWVNKLTNDNCPPKWCCRIRIVCPHQAEWIFSKSIHP